MNLLGGRRRTPGGEPELIGCLHAGVAVGNLGPDDRHRLGVELVEAVAEHVAFGVVPLLSEASRGQLLFEAWNAPGRLVTLVRFDEGYARIKATGERGERSITEG